MCVSSCSFPKYNFGLNIGMFKLQGLKKKVRKDVTFTVTSNLEKQKRHDFDGLETYSYIIGHYNRLVGITP